MAQLLTAVFAATQAFLQPGNEDKKKAMRKKVFDDLVAAGKEHLEKVFAAMTEKTEEGLQRAIDLFRSIDNCSTARSTLQQSCAAVFAKNKARAQDDLSYGNMRVQRLVTYLHQALAGLRLHRELNAAIEALDSVAALNCLGGPDPAPEEAMRFHQAAIAWHFLQLENVREWDDSFKQKAVEEEMRRLRDELISCIEGLTMEKSVPSLQLNRQAS
jgi:hypothetical protein